MDRDGKLVLDPYYQRSYIWGEKQKYALVDTVLRKYPVPEVFLCYRKIEGRYYYRCIDGQQRLRTLIDFYNGNGFDKNKKFRIKQVSATTIEIDPSYVNQSYAELSESNRKKFKTFQVRVAVIETDDDELEEELYHRLNTNVDKVNDQELRHAKFHGDLRAAVLNISKKYRNFVLENGILSRQNVARKLDTDKLWNTMFLLATHGRIVTGGKKIQDDMYRRGKNYPNIKTLSNKIENAMEQLIMIFPPEAGPDKTFRNLREPSIFTAQNDLRALLTAIYMMERGMFMDKNGDFLRWKFPTSKEGNKKMRDTLVDFSDNSLGMRDKKKRKPINDKNKKLVKEYHSIYADSHTNSQDNQFAKADIMKSLLSKFCIDISKASSADYKTRLRVWIESRQNSRDRKVRCARCKQVIETFAEMDAGHVTSKADGGPGILKNLQPEHGKVVGFISCSRSHNQDTKF